MNKRNKLFSLFCLLGFSLTACQNISSATTSAEASDLPSVTTSTDEPSSDVASSESAFDSEEESTVSAQEEEKGWYKPESLSCTSSDLGPYPKTTGNQKILIVPIALKDGEPKISDFTNEKIEEINNRNALEKEKDYR